MKAMPLVVWMVLLVCPSLLLAQEASPWEKEIIYQIFPRSFYDSNGDRIGDFKGIQQKLGYLHRLGVTAILLQPVVKSRVYHNYFDDDFFQVDRTLGTNKSFFDMIRAAHRRHIKVILDMEVQYVADHHPWYVAAAKNPNSPEAKYLYNMHSGFLGGGGVRSYTGLVVPIANVRTSEPHVVNELHRAFKFWAAPPGRPQDGVDGFRLDHMMDDLDGKHVDTNMLADFWTPLEKDVRSVKPKTFFVAEQADWTQWGEDLFAKGGVDAVYSIPLHTAFVNVDNKTKKLVLNADKVRKALFDEQLSTPKGKTQLLFVEDHDVERYASVVKSDPRLLRLGAVFMLTTKGTPSIYYGQELGMKGVQGHGRTDGNDIPVRLAFRWTARRFDRGTATWYREQGPWWNPAFSADHDGISVAEEQKKPDSLLNFYRKLIALRKSSPALSHGSQGVLRTDNPSLIAYVRSAAGQSIVVVLNLAEKAVPVDMSKLGVPIRGNRRILIQDIPFPTVAANLILKPYGYVIVSYGPNGE